MNEEAPRPAMPWAAFVVAVPLIGLVYVHVPAKSALSAVLYDGFIALCAVAVARAGLRQPPGRRLPWLLVAGAVVSYVSGDLAWYAVWYATGSPPGSAA